MQVPLIGEITDHIVNPLIGLLFAVALVYFLFGVIQVISAGESEDKRTAGKRHMIWGVIGLAIMVSAFGILRVVCGTVMCN